MTIKDEVKAYMAKQAEDDNVLLLCKSSNVAGFTVYGTKATVVAALLGTRITYRDYGEGVGMVIATSIPSNMLGTATTRLGALYPIVTFYLPDTVEEEDDEDYDDEDEYDDEDYGEDDDEDEYDDEDYDDEYDEEEEDED